MNIEIDYNIIIKEVNLLDLSGQLLESKERLETRGLTTSLNNISFNLSNYSSGVYLIQFVTEKGTFYKKAIVE